MKVLNLVGGAKTTRELYRDFPCDEQWTLSYLHEKGIPSDLLFEMHIRKDVPPKRREYIKSLNGIAVLMPNKYEDIPASRKYPLDEVCADVFGNIKHGQHSTRLFSSSFDYMLGMAICDGYWRYINVFGFEMDMTTEWFYQRPGAYLMMGIAAGRGIEIFTPRRSKLFHRQLYGYKGIPERSTQVVERLQMVRDSYER